MNIIIAEDQSLLRDSLKSYLENNEAYNVITTASNGEQVVDLCEKVKPDIIIMDVKMPIMDGLEASRIIKNRYENIKIIVLTLYENEDDLIKSINNGADGYLLKDIEPEVLIKAIEIVNCGITVYNKNLLKDSFKRLSPLVTEIQENTIEEFAPGELEVIDKICQGKKNQEIANELNCSLGTVKNRIGSILSKTGLSDRTQIVIYAIKNGILS